MEEKEESVKQCGREQQIFAMNLMMELSNESMIRLKEQFEEKEIHVDDFVALMEEHLPASFFDVAFVRNLVNLFEEIDVNGDGGMEWEEFTSFIIESALVVQTDKRRKKNFNYVADVQLTDSIGWMWYSPVLKRILCSEDHTNNVILIDPANGHQTQSLNGHIGVVLCAIHIPSKHLFVTCSLDQTLAIWDEETGICLHYQTTVTKLEDAVPQSCLLWDESRNQLFSGGINGRINIWSINRTDKWEVCFKLRGK
ncbi:uncharacterized protein MONOS_7250 [Monocercomonoides exilis]|uniref:uncharacterized protein n=1 Tax=Monocercomonoides exilis TaxID=2049356 RepID=UPI00355A788E|nr:hypothetical protein MONOS_7250 [Monocercomonoides exilis]|eukprot:MONOS_7250.1-p1 / transcript=MONOS_7250.1 / gene=MONOS_7250 / organism=Monocercomonoides_exilis_PA203 / gene_product=unspecified product / transcript_product=unspecified product / location=Mono_scaffold00243:51788-52999(+) / protein_length=253 / sequence_SO=supercontig / SO=protein_coding / is_pseudo=false